MYDIEAIVTRSTPTELQLTGKWPADWFRAASLLALNSREIQRKLLPDESGPPFSRLTEEHTIPVNRNFHPDLKLGDRVIVRCLFPGESR